MTYEVQPLQTAKFYPSCNFPIPRVHFSSNKFIEVYNFFKVGCKSHVS